MTISREERAARKASKRSSMPSLPAQVSIIKPTSPSINIGIESDPSPGYLGSTSYLATFQDSDRGIVVNPDSKGNNDAKSPPAYTIKSDFMQSSFERAAVSDEAARVLKVFQYIDVMDAVMSRMMELPPYGRMPDVWVHKCWNFVKTHYGSMRSKPFSNDRMKIELERLFENTSRPVQVKRNTTADEYIDAHLHKNVKWESIAYVLALLGTATKIIPKADSLWSEINLKISREDFGRQMLRLGQLCLGFCEKLGRIGTVWLFASSQMSELISYYYGDTSYLYWERFGSVISACYAFGFHQNAANESGEDPMFLVELKKQLFTRLYMADKTLSTLLGRPPRLPKKYCKLEQGMDLTPSELVMEESQLQALIGTLDKKGWAPPSARRGPVWGCIVLQAAILREEILELSLAPLPSNTREVAEDIMRRSRQAYWVDLPPHARYHAGLWSSGASTGTCMAITMAYLQYTYNDFLLQRILVRRLRHNPNELLRLARQMLSDVLELVSRQDRLSSFRADLDWIIALYGLPAAGVLALELLHQREAPEQDFPRSEVIQKLSVLVSCLDWAAAPGDGNYALCRQAGELLSRILDSVLSFKPAPPLAGTEQALVPDSYPDPNFVDWSWFDNMEYDGEFWNQLAEHPFLHHPEHTG